MDGTPTKVDDIFGEKLYQQRARIALPILVRQAMACQSLTYGELAQEIEMPNARNLNFVLGSIGVTLENLGGDWNEEIPRIQCLVKNQDTGLPGDGVFEFMFSRNEIAGLGPAQKEIAIKAILARIYVYEKWFQVLGALELRPIAPNYDSVIEATRTRGCGTGESEEHKRLKQKIANNPRLLGLPSTYGHGETEFRLPSGDSVDVVFKKGAIWIAAEVKSRISNTEDITRGLFQCIKYDAVVRAWQGSLSKPNQVTPILALGGPLPDVLKPLRATLGIRVIDNLDLL